MYCNLALLFLMLAQCDDPTIRRLIDAKMVNAKRDRTDWLYSAWLASEIVKSSG